MLPITIVATTCRIDACICQTEVVYLICPDLGGFRRKWPGPLRSVAMDVFSVALLFFAAVFLGAVLIAGFVALVQIRRGHRERIQMKQHLRNIDVVGGRSA